MSRWSSPEGALTKLLTGEPLAIGIAFLVAVSLPIILHAILYRAAGKSATTHSFVLLGTTGAGKTSLHNLLQKRSSKQEAAEPALTRISQASNSTTLLLPGSIPLGSNQYRSKNDAALQEAAKTSTKYQLIDTPGHGKLRQEFALSFLKDPATVGIIFLVDSASLDGSDASVARDTAAYLHDVLLMLQRRTTGKGSSKAKKVIAVLIAANKQDLFTALPQGAVRQRLETELERVRTSKSRGLTTVGDDEDADPEEETLGGAGEEKFSFKLLNEESGISVEVLGGAVKGEEAGKGVGRWEEWIGSCL